MFSLLCEKNRVLAMYKSLEGEIRKEFSKYMTLLENRMHSLQNEVLEKENLISNDLHKRIDTMKGIKAHSYDKVYSIDQLLKIGKVKPWVFFQNKTFFETRAKPVMTAKPLSKDWFLFSALSLQEGIHEFSDQVKTMGKFLTTKAVSAYTEVVIPEKLEENKTFITVVTLNDSNYHIVKEPKLQVSINLSQFEEVSRLRKERTVRCACEDDGRYRASIVPDIDGQCFLHLMVDGVSFIKPKKIHVMSKTTCTGLNQLLKYRYRFVKRKLSCQGSPSRDLDKIVDICASTETAVSPLDKPKTYENGRISGNAANETMSDANNTKQCEDNASSAAPNQDVTNPCLNGNNIDRCGTNAVSAVQMTLTSDLNCSNMDCVLPENSESDVNTMNTVACVLQETSESNTNMMNTVDSVQPETSDKNVLKNDEFRTGTTVQVDVSGNKADVYRDDVDVRNKSQIPTNQLPGEAIPVIVDQENFENFSESATDMLRGFSTSVMPIESSTSQISSVHTRVIPVLVDQKNNQKNISKSEISGSVYLNKCLPNDVENISSHDFDMNSRNQPATESTSEYPVRFELENEILDFPRPAKRAKKQSSTVLAENDNTNTENSVIVPVEETSGPCCSKKKKVVGKKRSKRVRKQKKVLNL